MRIFKMLLVNAILLFFFAPAVFADDFAWTRDLNVQAHADPSGFRAMLGTRFKIGDVEVNAVLSNFENPSDAYIALRFGELCGRPVGYVVEKYKSGKGQGWGNLAKSLGIKPGSAEFHALKQGHDLKFGHGSDPGRKGGSISDKGGKNKSNGKEKNNKKK